MQNPFALCSDGRAWSRAVLSPLLAGLLCLAVPPAAHAAGQSVTINSSVGYTVYGNGEGADGQNTSGDTANLRDPNNNNSVSITGSGHSETVNGAWSDNANATTTRCALTVMLAALLGALQVGLVLPGKPITTA